MLNLSSARKNAAYYFTQPVVRLLAKTSVSPDVLTWLGFLITLGAMVLIITGHLLAAGVVVLLAGFFDILDGALARRTNRITDFGAVLDSTLDRLSEAIVLIGILVFYVLRAEERPVIVVLLVGLTMIGSFLVSYIRARAEGRGIECQEGIFTRSERVVLLALGLLLNQLSYALITALAIIMVFSFVTVGERLIHVWRQAKTK